MKSFFRFLTTGAFVVSFCACYVQEDLYSGVSHQGGIALRYTALETDTLRISADQTSMEGIWIMDGERLFFVDAFLSRVKEYDLQGEFLSDRVRQGRASNEMINPAIVAAMDHEMQELILCDYNFQFASFNMDFIKKFQTDAPFFYLLQDRFGRVKADHKDPYAPQAYQYSVYCNRMIARNGMVTLPVSLQLASYNGYDPKMNASDVWRRSATFLSFDIRDIAGTVVLWGGFPPRYRKSNIPVFSYLDYCVTRDGIAVSFPVDPNIYLFKPEKGIMHSFGVKVEDIGDAYPETHSYEEAEKQRQKLLAEKGHYGRLFYDGDLLFRSYYTDARCHGLQIYEGSVLVGDIQLHGKIEIVGKYEDTYYSFSSIDIDSEQFIFTKFKLR